MTSEIILPKVEMDMASEIETNPMTKETNEAIEQQATELQIEELQTNEPKDLKNESLKADHAESVVVDEAEPEENLEEKLVAAIEELERNLAETIRQGERQQPEEIIRAIIKDEDIEEELEEELEKAREEVAEIIPEVAAEVSELDPREGKVRATPSARRIAREFKVDIKKATGTGKNGRIEADDVKKLVVIQPGTFSYKSKEPVVIGTNLDEIDGNPRNLFSIPVKLEENPNKRIVSRKKLKDMNHQIEKQLNPELDFVPFVDENAEIFEPKDVDVVTKISALDFVPFVDIKAEPLREEIIVKPTPMHQLHETELKDNGPQNRTAKGLRRKTVVQDKNETEIIEEKISEAETAQPEIVKSEPVELKTDDLANLEPEALPIEIKVPETEATETNSIKPLVRSTVPIELSNSQLASAVITLTTEIDMTEIKDLRKKVTKKIEDQVKYRCTYTDFLLLATSRALMKHPLINARLENDAAIAHAFVHMGLTVESEKGLIVPVIENTQVMNFAEMVKSRGELLKTVKTRQLPPEQLQGSTFTITNLGMYGIREFTAIINQPNSAVLSVGEVVQRIRVHQGEPVVRSVMKISLNLDHRIADGVEGAKFLQDIKADMENPSLLLF